MPNKEKETNSYFSDNLIINKEKEYKDNYNKNIIDNERAIDSAFITFKYMDTISLIELSENYNHSSYGNDPKIADLLLEELKNRNLLEEAYNFEYYLNKIDYKKPWIWENK